MNIELIPVLQIPMIAHTQLQEIHRPPATFQQNPIEWDEYQRQLLSTGGFSNYQRVIQGCNFVRVDQWSSSDLRMLVQNHLCGDKEPIPVEESCALFGGCILVVDGAPVLVPQCCSTIADFLGWKELLNLDFVSGPFCIEGHPCPNAAKSGNQLLITCADEWEKFDQPAHPQIAVELDELANALVQAQKRIDSFADKIDSLSAELGVKKASDYLVWAKS